MQYGRTSCPPLRHILSLWNETAGLTVLGIPPPLSEQGKVCKSPQGLYHTVRRLLLICGQSSRINSVQKQILSSWESIFRWGEEVKGVKRGDIQVRVIGVSTLGYCSTVLSQCPSVLLSARWEQVHMGLIVRLEVRSCESPQKCVSELCEYCLNAL